MTLFFINFAIEISSAMFFRVIVYVIAGVKALFGGERLSARQ